MLNPAADGTESNGHQPGDLTAEDAAGPAEGPEDTAPIPDLPAPDLAAGPGGADPAEVVVWLITGVIAGGQRHYYSSSSANCAKAGTVLVTILAGPLNYVGVNPKVSCLLPKPSS